jgi:hypothetical protein
MGAAAAALEGRPGDVPITALEMAVSERVNMPPRDGATEWLNSEPLGRVERDHVVLVNFWALDIERVRAATKDGAIDEPVVVDNSLDERPIYERPDRLRTGIRSPVS